MKPLPYHKEYDLDVEPLQTGDEKLLNLAKQIAGAIEFTGDTDAEFIIKEKGELFENIFNFLPIPLIITRKKTGAIILISAGVETILQTKKADIIGKKIHEIFVDKKALIPILSKLDTHGKVLNNEISIRNIHGESISCLISIETITTNGESLFLNAFTNISERKILEVAIQNSEDNLRTVFENTEVGYILFDQFQSIVSFNKPASIFAIKEFNKEINIGTNFSTYFPEIMRDYLTNIIAPVLNGETTSFERFIIHNSEHHWYYVKFSPVFNKDQLVAGFIMSMENITERKKNEIELNKSLSLVTEQNKRLLNFSYIVSHNLRSHASNMSSILNFLEKEKSETEKAGLMIHLKKVSQLLNETLFNLNEVVSIQKNLNTTLEKLNLFEYINQAISILNKEIEAKNVVVNNQVPLDILINYNPAYLESILLNFLSNAIKYASPHRLPIINFSTIKKNNIIELTISDNGIGIDMNKYHDRLFGMYKTFHGNKDARGIGLFITKNQIDAMGGKIEVISEINKGTSFKITFV
jgi:PAS domain S-box-containing protein